MNYFYDKAIIMEAIPDVPEYIEIQLQRANFIVGKLIDQLGDEKMSELNMSSLDSALIIQDYPLYGGEYSNETENALLKNMH